MATAAELIGVSVTYPSTEGPVQALRGASLACDEGTSTSIVGRSGSGKSTLISVLSLLREPTEGHVVVGGRAISELSWRDKADLRANDVGIVFQAFHLEPALTVAENVMLSWHFNPGARSRRQALGLVRENLDLLGIGDLARRHPNSLSGGQRQRVAIARALFRRPGLLVADEPTGNLDEQTAEEVAELLLGLPGSLGTAVVIVTHDRRVAELADRRLELVRGEVRDASA